MDNDATTNRQRVAASLAREAAHRQDYIEQRIPEVSYGLAAGPYMPYDVTGQSNASTAITFLRRAIQARLHRTLAGQLAALPEATRAKLLPILTLCVPEHETWDTIPLARAFFMDYAQACLERANTAQLLLWLEQYRRKSETRDSYALEVLVQRAIRGVQLLAYHFREADNGDMHAISAVARLQAEREYSEKQHRYWHALTDKATGTPLTARQQKSKHSNRARKERAIRNGTKVKH